MVQLKLTLKSKRPSTVYSSNGKSYRLLPGSNVLNLDYEDYLALAKSLSIKPVQKEEPAKEEHHEDPVKEEVLEEPVKEESQESREESVNEEVLEEPVKEESQEESQEEHHEDPVKEEPVEESSEESVNEESHEESSDNDDVDYSSWSYTDLKAEYKNITGKSCKLKKEEIIKFLQENKDNVE